MDENKKIKYLVADTTAFINAVQLHEFAENIFTVPDVVAEVRNKRQIRRLVVMPFDLIVREPRTENIKYCVEFAKKTGDYASLSGIDIKVIALTYELELEHVGSEHLRIEPVLSQIIASRDKPAEFIDRTKLVGWYNPNGQDSDEEDKDNNDSNDSSDNEDDKIDAVKESIEKILSNNDNDDDDDDDDGTEDSLFDIIKKLFENALTDAILTLNQQNIKTLDIDIVNKDAKTTNNDAFNDIKDIIENALKNADISMYPICIDSNTLDAIKQIIENAFKNALQASNDSKNVIEKIIENAISNAIQVSNESQQNVQTIANNSDNKDSITTNNLDAIQDIIDSIFSKAIQNLNDDNESAGTDQTTIDLMKESIENTIKNALTNEKQNETNEDTLVIIKNAIENAVNNAMLIDTNKNNKQMLNIMKEIIENIILNTILLNTNNIDDDLIDDSNSNIDIGGSETVDDDGWITPSNIKNAKKALEGSIEIQSTPLVACLSTDFAIQNVIKQMNLKLCALNGCVIKQLRTFILRCYACFKTTSIMTKIFCPNCGNKTLKRVSVSLDENGKQVVHINTRRPLTAKYKNQSLPRFQGGKHSRNPILFEDQPIPRQMPSRVAKTKTNALDEDYIAGYSPFVLRDIDSKSAILRTKGNLKAWAQNNSYEENRRKKHYNRLYK